MDKLTELIILALATWQVVETYRHGSIFAGLRAELEIRPGKVGELFSCMFCLSHWAALLVVIIGSSLPASPWQILEVVRQVLKIIVLALAVTRAAQLGHDLSAHWCRSPER